MKQSILVRVVIILAIYLGLTYLGGDVGRKIMYPIRLLVTFLHELGHALGSLITGGEVEQIQINQDGSGYTTTIGGNRAIILMGGYLGSALLGNLLFFIGARAKALVKPSLFVLSAGMIYTSIFWFNSMFTSIFLILFAAGIALTIFKTNYGREILMFLGLASILYIIQDFNVGPTSDLTKYAEIMKVLPANVWMYVWLGVAVLLFVYNLYIIFRTSDKQSENIA